MKKRLQIISLLLALIATLFGLSGFSGSVPQPLRTPAPSLSSYQREITPRRLRQPSITYLSRRMDIFHETFDVYTNADSAGNHFAARGRFNSYRGEDGVPPMIEFSTDNPHSGLTCIKASFKSKEDNWGGWYFMNGVLQGSASAPDPNWGDIPNAGIDLRGSTQLTFYARGAEGGEDVEFFALGVGRKAENGMAILPYPDSSTKVSLGYVALSAEWRRYSIDLAGRDLSYVLGGFGWVSSAYDNPNRDITFYIDDIQYDKSRLDEPRFLASFETIRSDNPFDTVATNVAFTYDNAVALISFVIGGERERARLVADALIYAQEHDRYYNDGRIRNAYQAGDLILPAGWTPNGKSGTARMPGFSDPQTGAWMEDEFQVSTHTGNMAWGMLGLLAHYQWVGGSRYLAAVERMGEWVERNCRDARGAGGYTGGFDGWEPAPLKRMYKATEHNIDLVSAFQQLFLITGNEKWRERGNHAKRFVLAMWDETEGKFWTGSGEDGVTIYKDVIPVDIQAWALLALSNESGPYWKALDYAEAHHKVGEGFDFNQDRDGIWYEGTAQMGSAYLLTGQQAKYQAITGLLKTTPFSRETHLFPGGIFAASKDGLTTGFTLNNGQPWLYYRRLHVGATAWAALAEQGANPFRVTRPSERVGISGRISDGNGLEINGVIVKLEGSERDATITDANGNYAFGSLLKGGSYTVAPSKTNLAFTPKSQSFNNISSDRTAGFTSIRSPIIASVNPAYALQGASVSSFTVKGVNLSGSTFSFVPALNPSAITVRSAAIDPSGTTATLSLSVSANAIGPFALVATNTIGSSEDSLSQANALWVLDPRRDTDGDGYPDGVEVEVGSNPCDSEVTPLIVPDFPPEAVGAIFSVLNTAGPSQALASDPNVAVNEDVREIFSTLNAADSFNSSSNGSDGALNLTTPGTVIFDPTKFNPPLDPDGDNVFHFTTIMIGSGVTVKLKSAPLRGKSVIWLASGEVRIEGIIDLSGQAGQAVNDPVLANRVPAEPGPGGFAGGVGSTATSYAQPGRGPGSGGMGLAHSSCPNSSLYAGMEGGGAGHVTVGSGFRLGRAYGNVILVPLSGGSGGGGGNGGLGGGGGGGGGALRIVSSASITVSGTISANGGDGGSGSSNRCILGNGGGGSGGSIHLIAPTLSGTGNLFAKEGGGVNVAPGSVGRIRLDAFLHQFTGIAIPSASLGSPYNVPFPKNVPSVRVISVAGVPVPLAPSGSFAMPDVAINQAAPVPVVIEAANVPPGIVAQVYLISGSAPDQIVNSLPLAGTFQKSSATASVKIPPGFSRGYVRVIWWGSRCIFC